MMKTSTKSYSELIKLKTFDERFDYLKLDGSIGEATFGGHRYLNQILYQTPEWKRTRLDIILRDDGCDLAHRDYIILGPIYIHHINPITVDDILRRRPCIFDLNNLISCSYKTHNALHYGNEKSPYSKPAERSKNDTCPWK